MQKSDCLRIFEKHTHTHKQANWGSQHLTEDQGSGCEFSICSFLLCPTGESNQDTVRHAQRGSTGRENCLSNQKTGRGLPLGIGAQGNSPVVSHTLTSFSHCSTPRALMPRSLMMQEAETQGVPFFLARGTTQRRPREPKTGREISVRRGLTAFIRDV